MQRQRDPIRDNTVNEDAKIYQEHRFALTRYATVLAGPDEAPDVVSAVIIRALEKNGGLSGLRDPRPYLMKAVLNEVRSRLRRRQVVSFVPLGETAHPAVADHHDGALDLVAALPPRQRAAAFLVYWEQHTPTEAAHLMGCRPATVRRYLHLARSKLKEALDG